MGRRRVALDFDTQIAVSADLIARWDDLLGRRTGVCLILPVYTAAHLTDPEDARRIYAMSAAVAELRAQTGVVSGTTKARSRSRAISACSARSPHSRTASTSPRPTAVP